MSGDVDPYLDRLNQLPFVRRANLGDPRAVQDLGVDALNLSTKNGTKYAFRLQVSKSHLSTGHADLIRHLAKQGKGRFMVFAPRIGGEIARSFEDAGVNFVDRAGNCLVNLDNNYFVRIEGRREEERPSVEREMRPASLQVLLGFLVRPDLLDSPVRSAASVTGGVSPQTVSDLRKRLLTENWIFEKKKGFEWTPEGRLRGLDALTAAAPRLLRSLEIARFRSTLSPNELERKLEELLGGREYWWGGGAAISRETGYYRGRQTIVYLEPPLPDVRGVLLPDKLDDVTFRRLPGTVAVAESGDLHPLVVYLDLFGEREPRAFDAAGEVRERLLEEWRQ